MKQIVYTDNIAVSNSWLWKDSFRQTLNTSFEEYLTCAPSVLLRTTLSAVLCESLHQRFRWNSMPASIAWTVCCHNNKHHVKQQLRFSRDLDQTVTCGLNWYKFLIHQGKVETYCMNCLKFTNKGNLSYCLEIAVKSLYRQFFTNCMRL